MLLVRIELESSVIEFLLVKNAITTSNTGNILC